jgi:hypothetical protein
VLFSPALDHHTGALVDQTAAYDPVRQVEGGFKSRSGGIIVNVTAFHANTRETNSQIYNDETGNQVFGVVQTSSYAQDVNQLKMPGYTTVGAFLQVRPIEHLSLGINAATCSTPWPLSTLTMRRCRPDDHGFGAGVLLGAAVEVADCRDALAEAESVTASGAARRRLVRGRESGA